MCMLINYVPERSSIIRYLYIYAFKSLLDRMCFVKFSSFFIPVPFISFLVNLYAYLFITFLVDEKDEQNILR